jgi:16S rRNA processing protein RimM
MNRAPKPVLSQAEGLAERLAEGLAERPVLRQARPERGRRAKGEAVSPLAQRSTVPEKERLISLGRVVNTHGVRGYMRLLPHHFPCPTLKNSVAVFLRSEGGSPLAYQVEKTRSHRPFILLKLKGVESIEMAQALVGTTLLVKEQDLPPLREGEFYHYQVIGIEVVTTKGTLLGTIKEVFSTGSNDVWVIRQGRREYLIPVIDEVVRSLDIPGKKATIEPQEGLLG